MIPIQTKKLLYCAFVFIVALFLTISTIPKPRTEAKETNQINQKIKNLKQKIQLLNQQTNQYWYKNIKQLNQNLCLYSEQMVSILKINILTSSGFLETVKYQLIIMFIIGMMMRFLIIIL